MGSRANFRRSRPVFLLARPRLDKPRNAICFRRAADTVVLSRSGTPVASELAAGHGGKQGEFVGPGDVGLPAPAGVEGIVAVTEQADVVL